MSHCPPLSLLVQIGRNLTRGCAAELTALSLRRLLSIRVLNPFGFIRAQMPGLPMCAAALGTGMVSQRGWWWRPGGSLHQEGGGRVPLASRAPSLPASLSFRLQSAKTHAGEPLSRGSEAPSASFLGAQGRRQRLPVPFKSCRSPAQVNEGGRLPPPLRAFGAHISRPGEGGVTRPGMVGGSRSRLGGEGGGRRVVARLRDSPLHPRAPMNGAA